MMTIAKNRFPYTRINDHFAFQIEYEIRSIDGGGIGNTSSDTFNLDSVTGVLTTRAILDRETVEVYTIIITATDRAVPATDRKSATGTIVVKVLDENDNYPQFAERTYTVFVAEDTNPNMNPKIATIKYEMQYYDKI